MGRDSLEAVANPCLDSKRVARAERQIWEVSSKSSLEAEEVVDELTQARRQSERVRWQGMTPWEKLIPVGQAEKGEWVEDIEKEQ